MEMRNAVGIIVAALVGGAYAGGVGGLIYTGYDTLGCGRYSGAMDFLLREPCRSVVNPECRGHLGLYWNHDAGMYMLADLEYFKQLGNTNLDSVAWAPPDSEMVRDAGYGLYAMDAFHPDSLAQAIGNVYVFKCRYDGRVGVKGHMYAKIKIVDFWIRDVFAHEIDMAFVWAVQRDLSRDLGPTNIDTIELDYHVDTLGTTAVNPGDAELSIVSPQASRHRSRSVLRVGNGGVWVVGTGSAADVVGGWKRAVWDLRGRRRLW